MSETDLDRPQRTKYFHWSTYDVNHAKTPSDLCRMTWSTVMNTAERSNNLIVVRSSSSYGMSRSVRQNLCRTIHSSSLDDQLDTQTTRLEATFRRDDSRSVAPEQNWGLEMLRYDCTSVEVECLFNSGVTRLSWRWALLLLLFGGLLVVRLMR